jgi:hypothetical protein
MNSNLVLDVLPIIPVEIYHLFIGWKIKPCGGNSALCRKCRKELGATGKTV